MRVLRDADYSSLDKIYVGTSQLEESVNSVLKIIPPAKSIPIIHCAEDKDMFHTMGLHEQMLAIMRPRVDLENGAYLIIERTEALTSIDVNTGKYTGENSLEETVFNTNMLAAAEIARQVKLRNIGGIVVVDFIDMNDEAHQTAVVQTLEKALSEDRAKCKVAPMSRFGLVEFTRKRVGVSPMNFMINSCKHCGGAGDTRSQEFILFDVRAKLMDILSEGNTTITLDMNYDLAQKLFSWQEMCDSIKRSYPTSKVYVIPHRTYAEDTITFTVLPSPAIDNHNAKLLY
jgi:ribonuclease G